MLGVAGSPGESAHLVAAQGMLDQGYEIWAVNEAGQALPPGSRPTRVFQLHPRRWRERERRYLNGGRLPKGLAPRCFGRGPAHMDYLRTCGAPVYCQRLWADIPTCVVYPFERVRQRVGVPLPFDYIRRTWATSSFGWMAALLLTEHLEGEPVEALVPLAIELPLGTWREQRWEWPNFAWYLGLAQGLGVRVELPLPTSLLSGPLYGLQPPRPGDCDHWLDPGYAAVVLGAARTFRLGTYRPRMVDSAQGLRTRRGQAWREAP